MKITFLGSSHGVPEANRRCSCAMITLGEKIYFVDMGVMVIEELRKRGIPVEAVQGIFCTHMHGDHTNGLVHFVDLISWYFKQADPAIYLPNMDAAKVIEEWLRVTLSNVRPLRYFPVQAGEIFNDGVLKVTAIPTRHCPGSYAYLVEAEGKRVLFTGDLKNPGDDFPQVEGADLLICEAAHFPATDYEPVLKSGAFKKVCITHYSPRQYSSLFPLMEMLKPLPVQLATDGLEINL